jgi:hypothetical protein
MGISLKTRKMLWGRSGNRCAFPDCRRELVEDETLTDDPSIIGEEAHIVAKKEGGPRGESDLSTEERNRFSNLILLCRNHHKVVDDQVDKFTVDRLHKMKEEHLTWVDENLEVDEDRQEDELAYSEYIDTWSQLANLENWEEWSLSVLSHGQPSIRIDQFHSLRKVNKYILDRFWPGRYPRLEDALQNFRLVLNDFLPVFRKHAEKVGRDNEILETSKFYKDIRYGQNHDQKLSEYHYHVDLVQDLMLELTRAGNRVCREVRKFISPSFRSEEGVLLVQSGPHMDFTYKTFRVEYQSREESYPGLRKFMEVRKERDTHFSEGVSEDYFNQWDLR